MTEQERKGMLGEVFMYVTDGYEILSYVKAYDKNIGLTLSSMSDVDSEGVLIRKNFPYGSFEEDGTVCISSVTDMKLIEERLIQIRDTGQYKSNSNAYGSGPACNF